jgi:hypothetical protein
MNTNLFNSKNFFSFSEFKLNEPVQLFIRNKYLSCNESKNIVNLSFVDDESGRQRWIIEKDEIEDAYYIRNMFQRWDSAKYLGAPNKNNDVFLYTTKNRFTKWKITDNGDNYYEITYVGEKFDPTKINIVVSRYNEDITWALPYNDIAIIYNKGNHNIDEFTNQYHIENIGREGHTYLYHIIHNYNNLAERTIFLQGEWHSHNETILFGIDNYEKHLPTQPMGLVYLRHRNLPPIHIENQLTLKTDYGLNYLVMEINENVDYINYNFTYDWFVNRYKEENPQSLEMGIVDNFLSCCKFPKQLNPLSTEIIDFTFAALFSVCRDNILLYDKDVYINVLNELIRIDPQGGTNGYILERLWLYLFQYKE